MSPGVAIYGCNLITARSRLAAGRNWYSTDFRASRMNRPAGRRFGLALNLILLGGCVYLPETTTRFDPDCGIYERKAIMQPHQVGTLMGCRDEGCAVLLVAAGAVTAASAVISGSVVVIGNAVYWLEKQGQCLNLPAKPGNAGGSTRE